MTAERDSEADKVYGRYFPEKKRPVTPLPTKKVNPLRSVLQVLGVLTAAGGGAVACAPEQPPQPKPVVTEAPPDSPQAQGGGEVAYGYTTPTQHTDLQMAYNE